MFEIREFRFPEDYESVITIWKNAGAGIQLRRSDTPEEIQKKLHRDPDLFLVATLDGKIIGSVIGGFDGRRGMIYHLAVDQHCRETGTGSMLMSELEKRLKDKGCIRSYLLVTKDNNPAIQFYRKRGWMPVDNVVMYAKDLE